MTPSRRFGRAVTFAAALAAMQMAAAAPQEREHGEGARPEAARPEGRPEARPESRPQGRPEARTLARPAEPHPGPSHYQRVPEPKGWNERPANFDRGAYQHNFQASRAYRIGPYRRPPGWVSRHWGYGEILPRVFWGPQYLIADYWLFALETPPVGYEWVRYGNDALLVDINTGEVLQAEYGVFA